MQRSERLAHTVDSALYAIGEASNIAYVVRVSDNGQEGYAVCLNNGSRLAVFPTRDAAFYSARQHDLEPFSVH